MTDYFPRLCIFSLRGEGGGGGYCQAWVLGLFGVFVLIVCLLFFSNAEGGMTTSPSVPGCANALLLARVNIRCTIN